MLRKKGAAIYVAYVSSSTKLKYDKAKANIVEAI
jgi:hypothetical protein